MPVSIELNDMNKKTNMQIKLKPFNLSKEEYSRLLIKLHKYKYKTAANAIFGFIGIIVILILWGASQGIFVSLVNSWYPVVLLLIGYLWFLIYGQVYLVARSKMNRFQYQTYGYEIGNDFFLITREDGATSKFPLNKIVKSYCISNHYFLYENMYSAHILPLSSFPSKAALKEFESGLVCKQIKSEAHI